MVLEIAVTPKNQVSNIWRIVYAILASPDCTQESETGDISMSSMQAAYNHGQIKIDRARPGRERAVVLPQRET